MSRVAERGTALVIALLLVTILTLVAITGMRVSIAEMWMAGSERFHRKAAEAASAGVEAAIAQLQAAGGAAAADASIEGESSGAPYTASVRHAGTEASLPGSSAEKFVGEHFEIESTGASSRGALEVQVQGVLIVSATNGVRTFRRTSRDGLGPEQGP
jgi:Tfp pilus assembly protein PilX